MAIMFCLSLSSRSILIPLITIVVIVLNVGTFVSSFGIVDYNDDCEFDITDYSTFQTRYDQSKFCDTERGLYCVPGLGKCGCVIPHTIYRLGKCRAKIGNSCMAPGNVRLDCVEHGRCTKNMSSDATFKCQCIRVGGVPHSKLGYLSNAMKTACFPVGYNDRRYGIGDAYDRNPNAYYSSNYWRGAAAGIYPFTLPVTIAISSVLIFSFTVGTRE